ncbi:BTB/POZ domain-containing protein [Acorus calamus]|uniref:BTB/POZ domain-containing protein n=1 Tax=Acorus calamus TaxID=4465 RepID=A0AAV9C637_ACOCL|nr:BTB/POZ domain-containing protein [Acorus calamus]
MAPLNNATGTYDDFFNDPKHSDFVLQIEVTKGKMDDVAYAISEDEVLEQILANQGKNVQILRVEPLHMSSPILAKRSTLFQKLFSKLQMDPKSPIKIRISASKVEAFMELLHFMYGRKLSSATEKSRVALLDLATVADKYGVHSCLNQCIHLLSKLPMTKESASFYLEMASHVKATSNIRSLANAAKTFLIARYKDASEYKEEMCNLSFAAMQAIFDRDDIRVESEDALYDIIVKWAENRFPKLEQRRAIFRYSPSYITDITDIVRFPHMSYEKLREILPRHDFDPEFARNVINDALFFKAEPLNLRWTVTVGSKAILKWPYIKREYMKSTYDFHLSRDQCKK